MAETKRADVLSYLENANMLEISELISEIEEKFGVTAAAPAVGLMKLHLKQQKLHTVVVQQLQAQQILWHGEKQLLVT